MSIPNFKKFILSLHTPLLSGIQRRGDPDEDLWDYIIVYDCWRRRLPRAAQRNAPKLKFCYISEEPGRNLERSLKHFFFPIRFITYQGEEQFNKSHPENKIISEETEQDRAALTRFIQYLKSVGTTLDTRMIKFGYMKDKHPSIADDDF
ncbi:hypothetical protein AMATHDRAFT_70608 [Amanita thiersii Skay4041]|uniref:Uncharacterized protein n=1 Tax=Amanita thiersii Skay4041 TaxID=703135 RepID=A0A2A9NEH0_9AGAR|nr:hypothetical protein AMATHDRAFT_70608 [Amanita thiersii Skay4041]